LLLQVISQGSTQMSVRLDEGHGIDDTRASDLAVDLPADSVAHNVSIPLSGSARSASPFLPHPPSSSPAPN
jgi:hypothetical protein